MQFVRAVLDFLFPPRDAEAVVRDTTPAILGAHLNPRMHEDGTVSLLPYRAMHVRACVTEAKFRDSEHAQSLLAGVLADYLASWSAEEGSFEKRALVLVPVPLSEERRAERGYNQAERIASKALPGIPEATIATDILARARDTRPQTSLSGSARRRNVHGAFSVVTQPGHTHTYIVIDDVRTTGATLAEAVHALRAAGATRIIGLSLAH